MNVLNTIARLLLLILTVCTVSSFHPWGSAKAAYRHHFKGTVNFAEGQYGRAEDHFRKAYAILPDNYTFALSLSACLGRNGNPTEALKILQKSTANLKREDREYTQKKVMRYFVEGVIRCYGKRYDLAIAPFKKSIELQEAIGNRKLLSTFYNALGYATLFNQGMGAHRSAKQAPHYHVGKRDMVRAAADFEKAIHYNPANTVAQTNYRMLADTLGLTAGTNDNLPVVKEQTGDYIPNMPGSILELTKLTETDELLLMLDISGSMVMEKVICMGVTRFETMRSTMLDLLDSIPARLPMGIGTIGGDCGTTPKLWHRTGSITRPDLQTALEFLVPDGTTPLLTILEASPILFSDSTTTHKTIFLVSDGANVCRANGLDICEWAARIARKNVTIHILTFLDANLNNTEAFTEYTCLADNTGGRVIYIDNYRCRLAPFAFSLVESFQFLAPEMQRVACGGPAVEALWAIFPE